MVKVGYQQSRAVQRYIEQADEKWQAVEGVDANGRVKSGVPLLASRLRDKLAEDIKAKELTDEARAIRAELLGLLTALTPSKDEAEERLRRAEAADQLATAVRKEMARRYSGAVFGELSRLLVAPEDDLEKEVRKAWDAAAPMSIKASDKVKKVLVHVLKWWTLTAQERVRTSDLPLPASAVDLFIREVCTSKLLMPVLGQAVFPYFSRSSVDTGLIAQILQVKICDAMLALFVDGERRTPKAPVRLSYSEDGKGEERAASVDWADVDFEEDAAKSAKVGVEIIFAGNRYFKHWEKELAGFYAKNVGGSKVAMDDPKVKALLATRQRVEAVDVPAAV
jgi:hypothetical protein